MKFNRVLLKLSGEALMGDNKDGKVLSKDVLFSIANQIKEVSKSGTKVGVVIGGGNLFRGKYSKDFSISKNDGDYMGMLSTVFNSLALMSLLNSIGLKSEVLSAVEMERVCKTYSSELANKLLDEGKVVIYAGGIGKPGFTTDTCAATRAKETHCEVILMAKNGVEGVYNKDPRLYADAKLYKTLDYNTLINEKLEVMDESAARICKENKINLIVFNMDKENAIIDVANGAKIGTFIGEIK